MIHVIKNINEYVLKTVKQIRALFTLNSQILLDASDFRLFFQISSEIQQCTNSVHVYQLCTSVLQLYQCTNIVPGK